MLVPKRTKHRREFRGKMRGEAKGGKEVTFGKYGLQAVGSHWITNRQIEAARIAMTHEAWWEGLDQDFPSQVIHS